MIMKYKSTIITVVWPQWT